jgi:hypothetical protein
MHLCQPPCPLDRPGFRLVFAPAGSGIFLARPSCTLHMCVVVHA